MEKVAALLEKTISDVPMCKNITVTDTDFATVLTTAATSTWPAGDRDCKAIEIRNYSGISIEVSFLGTDPFTMKEGDIRWQPVKKLSDIRLRRLAGAGNAVVNLIMEF